MKRMTSAATMVLFAVIAVALGASLFGDASAQTPQSTPVPQSAPAPQAPPPPQTIPVPPATPAPVATDTDHGTALMLLDRVATLLDEALNGKSSKTTGTVGTSGYSEGLGKVMVDRAALDEIRAEVAQIRLLLKDEPKSSVALRPREMIERAR